MTRLIDIYILNTFNLGLNVICIVHVLFRTLFKVVEMYSSGGDLHLELPTGQQGGTGKLWVRCTLLKLILIWRWTMSPVKVESLSCKLPFFIQEIPPFETKGVMRASFSSRDVDNHTAYIRIKTNAPNEDQFIILPVEVEVTSGVLSNPMTIIAFAIVADPSCQTSVTKQWSWSFIFGSWHLWAPSLTSGFKKILNIDFIYIYIIYILISSSMSLIYNRPMLSCWHILVLCIRVYLLICSCL